MKEVLQEIDHLGILPRLNGIKPYLLIDRHANRFELDFLSYINDPKYKWVVCIGITYGTVLWHIGDRPECNGALNMALARAMEDLLGEKTNMCVNAKLQNYDTIPLINSAWYQSYTREDKNANAGTDRG